MPGTILHALVIMFMSAGVLSVIPAVCHGGDSALVDEIIARQKGLESVSAAFSQQKNSVLLGRPIKSSGSFMFKPGVGVRWLYEGQMNVVYDGHDIYIHYLDMDEAEKLGGASEYAGPLEFDLKKLRKDYSISASKEQGGIRVTLVPLTTMSFTRMKMFFAEADVFPREVGFEEETGDITELRFRDIRVNGPLPDNAFTFELPPGVKLRQHNLQGGQGGQSGHGGKLRG